MTEASVSADVLELIDLFDHFGPRYSRTIHASLAHADTTPSRLRLLGVLSAEGPMPMNALAEAMCIAPRTVTSLVDGLEAEGMVRRNPHETDRRTKVIAPTEAGRAAFNDSRADHHRRLAELFSVLSPAELQAMIDGHRKLINAMSQFDVPDSD